LWFGNDDYTSTNRMTGGSLPAMTWHSIMEYAHQGIELKQLPGVTIPPRQPETVAEAKAKAKEAPPPRPVTLSKRGAEILVQVEHMMDDASRAMGPPLSTVSLETGKQIEKPQKADPMATALEGKPFGSRN
jgi:penicillin-binding protein 1A